MENVEVFRKGDDKIENLILCVNGVFGLMCVEEQIKCFICVLQLVVGDVICGIIGIDKNFVWCKVLVVFLVVCGQIQIMYDGFIVGQMVVECIVYLYGVYGMLCIGFVFILVMECDVVVNLVGKMFMFLSIVFCLFQLSWKQYFQLISLICCLIGFIGNFWFNLNVYYDNEIVFVLYWIDWFFQLCQEFL